MINEEYIMLCNEKYIVYRTFYNEKYIFGQFDSLEEAIKKRDELDYEGWPLYDECIVDEIDSSDINKKDDGDFEVYDPSKVKIANNPNYRIDIMNLIGNIEFIEESLKIPFPQSDDLNRFIFIGRTLLKKDLSKEEIRLSNQIGNRIVNMYTSTGFYFHVFEKYKNDKSAFLFSINKKKKYIARNDSPSIYCGANEGPRFGCGYPEIYLHPTLDKGKSYKGDFCTFIG